MYVHGKSAGGVAPIYREKKDGADISFNKRK